MSTSAADIISRINRLRPRNTSTIRSLRRRISQELAALDRESMLALAYDLVDSGDYRARWVADELVRDHQPCMGGTTRAEVERLGQGISSWDNVDCFASYISGRAWRTGRITYS